MTSAWARLRRRILPWESKAAEPERIEALQEAEEARRKANEDLRSVQIRSEEVHAVATSLRTRRERNHFGEALDVSMRLRRV